MLGETGGGGRCQMVWKLRKIGRPKEKRPTCRTYGDSAFSGYSGDISVESCEYVLTSPDRLDRRFLPPPPDTLHAPLPRLNDSNWSSLYPRTFMPHVRSNNTPGVITGCGYALLPPMISASLRTAARIHENLTPEARDKRRFLQ